MDDFEAASEEWDNVPPVIPRFQFYIQNCLQRTIEFTKEVSERQTTQELRDEMYDNLKQRDANLNNEVKERRADIHHSNNKEDDLQNQLIEINKYN